MRPRYRRLQHQLFAWLALTILVTGVVVALVLSLMQSGSSPFMARVEQVSAFAATQFLERWQDPGARDAYTRELAEAFGATIGLTDAEGNLLVQVGPPGCHGMRRTLDIEREGVLLGQVRACLHSHHRGGALTGLVVLGSACLVLWTAAALVARRITRPLSLLVGATREIGSGNLSARVRLGRHQRGELGLLAESVNDMAERIERQMRDQRELLAAVSHEVRSPLSRLRVCAEILRGDRHDTRALDAIEREVLELDTLIGKLLASSRLDFEMLTKQSVVLADLCREVMDRRQLAKGLLDDRTAGARVDVDPTLIARALDNLFDNAVRHGNGPSSCVLRFEQGSLAKPVLICEVHDSGPGFAPETLARAFDAFYRAGESSHAQPGSLGLGLTLVLRIAQAHGGQAWAENVPGGGARVAFSVAT